MTTPPLINKWPLSTLGAIGFSLLFAAGLIFQPTRWSDTPAYGNLLLLLTAQEWGLIYLGAAISLAVSLLVSRYRWLPLGAHVLAFVLMLTWEAAFIVRWITDKHTTVANVGAWATYAIIVVISARRIDGEAVIAGDLE